MSRSTVELRIEPSVDPWSETNVVASESPQATPSTVTPSAPRASLVTNKNSPTGQMVNSGPRPMPVQGQSGPSGQMQAGQRGPQIQNVVQRGPQGRPSQGGPRPSQAGPQQGRPPAGQQQQQQAPRKLL